jgi:hypothetical protein
LSPSAPWLQQICCPRRAHGGAGRRRGLETRSAFRIGEVQRLPDRSGWQTDVLAGCLIGTGVGCYAHRRDTPWTIQWVPGG